MLKRTGFLDDVVVKIGVGVRYRGGKKRTIWGSVLSIGRKVKVQRRPKQI